MTESMETTQETKKKPKTARSFNITQEDAYCSYEEALKALEEAGRTRSYKYAIVHHDKDGNKPHWHCYLIPSSPTYFETISNIFGKDENGTLRVPPQYIEKPRSVLGSLEYLRHENDPEKYQYPEETVISNFDFKALIQEEETKKNRGAKNKRLVEIINGIYDGTIKRYELKKDNPPITPLEYALYKSKIEAVFAFAEAHEMNKMNMEGFEMKILYLWGDSGTGKTTYAKTFAQEQGLDFYLSGSRNDPLDGFAGEPVLILDELRGSSFSFTDLLKLLDNHNSSRVHSRYYNKIITCKYIIITSVVPLDALYTREDLQGEPFEQLKRRCTDCIHFTDDELELYCYDKEIKGYIFAGAMPNIYKSMHGSTDTRNNLLESRNKFFFGAKEDTIRVGQGESYLKLDSSLPLSRQQAEKIERENDNLKHQNELLRKYQKSKNDYIKNLEEQLRSLVPSTAPKTKEEEWAEMESLSLENLSVVSADDDVLPFAN